MPLQHSPHQARVIAAFEPAAVATAPFEGRVQAAAAAVDDAKGWGWGWCRGWGPAEERWGRRAPNGGTLRRRRGRRAANGGASRGRRRRAHRRRGAGRGEARGHHLPHKEVPDEATRPSTAQPCGSAIVCLQLRHQSARRPPHGCQVGGSGGWRPKHHLHPDVNASSLHAPLLAPLRCVDDACGAAQCVVPLSVAWTQCEAEKQATVSLLKRVCGNGFPGKVNGSMSHSL